MSENPNKLKGSCPECGSTLTAEDGVITCTQDLLNSEYPSIFRGLDALSGVTRDKAVDNLTFKLYDMYKRWNFIDPTSGERTQFCCTYNPNLEFNPMTKAEMILPDPIQTKLAERILGRDLEFDEYYGIVKVPLLNEDGEKYWGTVEQLVFPRDYKTEYKVSDIKIDLTKLPVLFKLEDL